jgi:hypothetical protein
MCNARCWNSLRSIVDDIPGGRTTVVAKEVGRSLAAAVTR